MIESQPEYFSHERIIRPRKGLARVNFAELWRYRELFWFLSWRDILIRYKQTYLGVSWAIIQPVLTTLIFTVVFGTLARFDSNGVPTAVMIFAGLLPWQFFSNALAESSNSLVAQSRMISKVYFPRLIIPASAVLSGILDALISFVILFGLMVWRAVPFRIELLMLPLFLAFAFLAALAVGIWMSALNVKYRDVKYVVPFFTRIGLYASPVGFLSTLILDRFGKSWFVLYSLNPMVGVIDGFRWCVFGPRFAPYWPGFFASLAVTMLLLLSGLIYFRSAEKTFADLI